MDHPRPKPLSGSCHAAAITPAARPPRPSPLPRKNIALHTPCLRSMSPSHPPVHKGPDFMNSATLRLQTYTARPPAPACVAKYVLAHFAVSERSRQKRIAISPHRRFPPPITGLPSPTRGRTAGSSS